MKNLEHNPLFEAPNDQGVGKLDFEPNDVVLGYVSARQKQESDRGKSIDLTPKAHQTSISDEESMRLRPEWTQQFRLRRK